MNIDIEKFKNIPFEKRSHCVVCDEKLSGAMIELPDFPMTEIYTTNKVNEKAGFVDQWLQFCEKCGHGQIANVIDTDLQYGNSHFYRFRASESATGRESADFFIDFLNGVVGNRHFKNIVEIGCNDLYILKSLKSRADRLTGIDPILKGKKRNFQAIIS